MTEYHFTDGMYDCPWGCPFNIFPEDVEYHRQWHRDQGDDPDKKQLCFVCAAPMAADGFCSEGCQDDA